MTDIKPHADKVRHLSDILSSMGSVVIAYSGGVDSTFLAKVAHSTLGGKALAVTAVSPSLAASELEDAKRLADAIGVRHVLLPSNELSDPRYLANGAERCYFCKVEVYGLLASYARKQGFAATVDGTNLDDLRDPRPGRKAAREHGVLSPLVDAGFTKTDVREASLSLGLPTANKPSMACLSSRIPYGTPVTVASLRQIEAAEKLLNEIGLGQLRVRHHGDTARIEVDPGSFPIVIERRAEIVEGLKALGYSFVALDLEGYRTGSMNRAARRPTPPEPAEPGCKMDAESLRRMLDDVRVGRLAVNDAVERLRDLPFEDIGDTKIDHHRALRTGMPEAVFSQGKTPQQVADAFTALAAKGPMTIATRADPMVYEAVQHVQPGAVYYERARIIALGRMEVRTSGYVAVATGGTADMPVAEEAAITLELLGHPVERLFDVGAAGVHRLLAHRRVLYGASVVIVVAGMEGALASVVSGLVSCPLVAVPTSVGYGASFGGLAALLAMLNSCAPGVAVVNIDNGFGAAAFAHLVLLRGPARCE